MRIIILIIIVFISSCAHVDLVANDYRDDEYRPVINQQSSQQGN